MRKLGFQTGGMDGGENISNGFAAKIKRAIESILSGILTGGLSTLFGLIVLVLEVVIRILWFLFTVVIPYMVMYVGIPLFILGAIMALIFTVGHIFFLVAFFVGVYLYMKGIVKVAFPSSMFNLKTTPKAVKPVVSK